MAESRRFGLAPLFEVESPAPGFQLTPFVTEGEGNGRIEIGTNSSIQDRAVICSRGNSKIGDNVTIGPFFSHHAPELSFLNSGHGAVLGTCTINNNAVVGVGAILQEGVTVGKNAIVGAVSVVAANSVIPPNQVLISRTFQNIGVQFFFLSRCGLEIQLSLFVR